MPLQEYTSYDEVTFTIKIKHIYRIRYMKFKTNQLILQNHKIQKQKDRAEQEQKDRAVNK